MVYTPWKSLRLPFYGLRLWSKGGPIPKPWLIGGLLGGLLVSTKYVTGTDECRRENYYNGYPEGGWNPIKEMDQKYYTMYIRQHGIDITDPALTGMSRAALEEQIRA
eukprot:TRINITY_DN50629_c0_g1_i1.p1 TRINITY_DN50629_c0_g1~~TRINITY_DN50629_c0_g1_i1.p1  ORF type:complete len:125 (+),score=42.60 TRINITY_DN50629_c0_g1_i1:56-376(+)